MDAIGIDLNKIINSPEFSSIVKMTAVRLQKNPYMTVGDFFKSLTPNDLTVLGIMIELAVEKNEPQSISDIIVLTELLSRAEGTETTEVREATSNVNYFCTLVTACSLARKGLVDIIYENMSFGTDMKDKQIMKIKES